MEPSYNNDIETTLDESIVKLPSTDMDTAIIVCIVLFVVIGVCILAFIGYRYYLKRKDDVELGASSLIAMN